MLEGVPEVLSVLVGLVGVTVGPIYSYKSTKKKILGEVVSQSRHAWISEFRSVIANINTRTLELIRAKVKYENPSDENEVLLLFNELNSEIERAKLYLNNQQPSHQNLESALERHSDQVLAVFNHQADSVRDTRRQVTQTAQDVLKEAWEQIEFEAKQ